MSFLKEENIGKISFISSLIIVILLITILGSVFIRDKNKHFQKQLKRDEKNYTQVQKERLKSEVLIQVSGINSRLNNSEQNLKDTIKNRVYEAHAITENLFQKHKEINSPVEIKSLIKEALRPIRFNDGRGYIFIRSVDGSYILYPPDPSREGSNVKLSHFKDRKELFQDF
jgi:two-component system NtrC family sensor kinase